MTKSLGILVFLATTQAFAVDGITKFSGYADLRLTAVTKDSKTATNSNPESGYSIEDGAVYVTHQKDALSFNLDIPFRRVKNSDIGIAVEPNASNNNNVVLGNDKAQVYVKYSQGSFDFNMGQFDTMYGFELNDSKDRFFAKTGLVYDLMIPVTHTGVLFSYTNDGAYARLLAANSNNKGTLGNSTTGDNSYEYGAAVGYSNADYRVQVGYLTRPINKASGLKDGTRSLIDVTAGLTFGKFTADAEYAILADDNKNVATPVDATDKESSGTGLLALVAYNHDDNWAFAARVEQVEKITADKLSSLSVGAHYKWNAHLHTRVDNIQTKTDVAVGDDLTDNRFEISNLFYF